MFHQLKSVRALSVVLCTLGLGLSIPASYAQEPAAGPIKLPLRSGWDLTCVVRC